MPVNESYPESVVARRLRGPRAHAGTHRGIRRDRTLQSRARSSSTPIPASTAPLAIVLALRSRGLRVELVTTVAGNVGLRAATDNARRLLALIEPTDPPRLVAGAARPLRGRPAIATEAHGDDGLAGLSRVRDAGAVSCFPRAAGRFLPVKTPRMRSLPERASTATRSPSSPSVHSPISRGRSTRTLRRCAPSGG